MATEREDILVGLGFAGSEFDREVRALKGKMQEAGEHIAEHMERPRAATLAFHHAITELNKVSPLLGEGLMAAFNPVVGVLLGVGLAVEAIREHFKQAGEEAAKSAKEMAEGMTKTASAIQEARVEAIKSGKPVVEEFQEKETPKFIKELEESWKKAAEARSLYEGKHGTEPPERVPTVIRGQIHYYAEDEADKAQRIALKQAENEAKAKLDAAYANQRKATTKKVDDEIGEDMEQMWNEVGAEVAKKDQERVNKIKKDQETITKDIVAAERAKMSAADRLADMQTEALEREQELTNASLDAVKTWDKKVELANLNKEIAKETAAIGKENDRKQKEQLEFNQHRARIEREERQAEIAPYLPKIEELARTPGWDVPRFEMPHMLSQDAINAGRMARDLQATEGDLRRTMLNEGPGSERASADMARIRSLKDTLTGMGYLKEDHTEKIKDGIMRLVEKAEGQGLNVNPTMGS